MDKSSKHSLSILRWFATFYGIISLVALWALAFALTGNLLRSFLFIGALVLFSVTYTNFTSAKRSAHIIEMMPCIEKFGQEMKDNHVVGIACEKLHGGDAVYYDPNTGTIKKSK